MASVKGAEFQRVSEILSLYSGKTDVYIKTTENNKLLKAPERLRISKNSELIGKLTEILGNENVKFVE